VSDVVQGFAVCVNRDCEQVAVPRPIELARDVKEIWAPDLPIMLSSHEYISAVDPADLVCPGCGRPCAQMTDPPKPVAHA
jgi:hypothetical protein